MSETGSGDTEYICGGQAKPSQARSNHNCEWTNGATAAFADSCEIAEVSTSQFSAKQAAS